MGEFIELIGQLKPKNNGTFPIADVNDLKGGYIQLQYTTELNAYLDTGKVKQGMLAYVAETNKIYQFQQGIWIPWSGGSGGDGGGGGASIIKVDNLSDLNNPALKVVGQIVYVEEIKDLRYFDGTEWKSFTRIYIQPIPPEDKGGIWIDTSDEKVFDSSNGTILNLIQIISILEEKLRRVEWALGNQLDFGDFTNNHYQEYDDHPSPEEPVYGSDTEEDFWKMSDNLLSIIEEVEPTQFKSLTPTGKHLSIKGGTYAQMVANANNFLPNELLWCDDRKQLWIKVKRTNKLVQIGSVGGSTPGPDDETMEQILTQIVGSGPNAETKIVGIEFGDMNNLSNTYRLSVKDGKLDLYDYRLDRSNLAGNAQTIVSGDYYSKPYFPILSDFTGNTNSPMIYMNSIYCGGDSTSKDYNPCSHNFIEIVNLANIDLNLKGLYLHYTEKTTGQWVSLPLKGIIKAKGTFLIRGAACSVMDINTTYIKVKTFDIEWKKENTYNADVLRTTNPEQNIWGDDELIKFSNSCSFYISGEESTDYFKTNLLTDSAPWSAVGVKKWYVDLVGIGSYEGTAMPNEGAQIPATGKNFLYHRYHTMDFVSQAIKATTARKNSTEWTYLDLSKINPRMDIYQYIPKASFETKDVFYNKTLLTEGAPNIVTCSFGQNAHTTRCFSWLSAGYYDEYIWFADAQGEYLPENKFESFKVGDGRPSTKNWDDPIYDRLRSITTDGTAFTVHKFIKDWPEVSESTTINYKVGREGAWTSEKSFTLRNRDQVIASGHDFLHITDQQGFNKEEYESWRLSAEYIDQDRVNNDFDWIVNTGDPTQNGNRISEWLDYFNGGESIFKDKEQMYVVGNNDLSPENVYVLGTGTDLSKINSENIMCFYTFEHPYEVPKSATGKYIPSTYSFVYGDTYYLAMNTEISTLTREIVFKDPAGVNVYTDNIKPWAERDIIQFGADPKIKWKVAFNHESPFTIVTADLIMSYVKPNASGVLEKDLTVERGGSRLNTVGDYWFSKFLEDNQFNLVLCGHKHTYTNSRYIKDDRTLTMEPIVYDPVYDPDTNTYPDWYNALPDREKMCVRLSNDNTQHYVRYVMNQATGYKLSSNKELPAKNIPWLMEYYPVETQTENPATNKATVKLNPAQMYSHYIIWNIGEGNETENSTVSTPRSRIKGLPYKIVLTATPTTPWAYKYNTPIQVEQLTKVPANGSVNPTHNIIIEKIR